MHAGYLQWEREERKEKRGKKKGKGQREEGREREAASRIFDGSLDTRAHSLLSHTPSSLLFVRFLCLLWSVRVDNTAAGIYRVQGGEISALRFQVAI